MITWQGVVLGFAAGVAFCLAWFAFSAFFVGLIGSIFVPCQPRTAEILEGLREPTWKTRSVGTKDENPP